jgi:heme-degrading monooxygenase HmoA
MYIRLTTFPLRHGRRAEVEPIADRFIRLLAEQPGYQSGMFGFDDADDTFVAVSVWDSRAHAQAATANVRDAAQVALAEQMEGAPSTRLLEVYEPRT